MSILQFTDDIAVFIKCKKINRNKKILENSIKKIKDNLKELGLELSPAKTELIHFNKKISLPAISKLK